MRTFRIGGPDEALHLLYERGDSVEQISERFRLTIEEVEAAIHRSRARKQEYEEETTK